MLHDAQRTGAQRDEGLDEDGGLHGHVQRAGDARALQRLDVGELTPQLHEAGHPCSASSISLRPKSADSRSAT